MGVLDIDHNDANRSDRGLKITPERAKRIERAIHTLRVVKSRYPDEQAVESYYKQVASDHLSDLFDDWKQLRGQPQSPQGNSS